MEKEPQNDLGVRIMLTSK